MEGDIRRDFQFGAKWSKKKQIVFAAMRDCRGCAQPS